MIKTYLLAVACFVAFYTQAQSISYEFKAPNAAHHEAEISLTVTGLPAGPATFRMSRSSPGRYATHEFGKNVYNVQAFDAAGKPLVIEKIEGDVYRLTAPKRTVKVTYTLFGNHADGTYAGIYKEGYHLNIPATFMWVKGMDKVPITVKLNVPDASWKIATQLKPTIDPYTFTSPGLQYFMDSPIKAGDLVFKTWTIINPNRKKYNFRLALEIDTLENLADTFAARVKDITLAAQHVFGEVPAYDYGTYTFLASINPYIYSDGMEHRNSTMISMSRSFIGDKDLLSAFAHEFFHCWNVERIRPKSLEPFNFEKANMSEGLWLAEGFTQYYGSLLLVRAGLLDRNKFISAMSNLVNTKMFSAGGTMYSPVQSSQMAVFVDAGVAIDETNYNNFFTSYYFYGAAIALALDLQLRSDYNSSLDAFMQELWKRFGKSEIPYTLPGVQKALATVTKSKSFAADFFTKFVYGHESFDYVKLFAAAGYGLTMANNKAASLGAIAGETVKKGLLLYGTTTKNTPLYQAGIDQYDIITSIENSPIVKPGDVDTALSLHKPGDTIAVTYLHHGKEYKANIKLQANPNITIADKTTDATNEQKQLRESWLTGK